MTAATSATSLRGYTPVVATTAAERGALSPSETQWKQRTCWQAIIDGKLIEWGRNSLHGSDVEEVVPPSKLSVTTAAQIACIMRDRSGFPPTTVVPDGDGGIVFEWQYGPFLMRAEFLEGGGVEVTEFENGEFKSREPLQG